MSSEAITRNDLEAVLNSVLPPMGLEYTTKAMTSNVVGHSAETTLTTIDLDAGTYIITANIYRSSSIAVLLNRLMFRIYAGSTIIGGHDYRPGGSSNTSFVNDTITTVVKLTATTTIKLNGYVSHTADIGVDYANLHILKIN